MQTNSSALRYANIAFFILTVIVNGIAGSTALIGGQDTAAVSDKYPTLVTPAGYVFSIWGIIYFLLGVFVVFQALPRERSSPYHKQIGALFILSSILNISWIFVWQFEILIASVVLIVAFLLTLIAIYLRLDIGKSKVRVSERLAVQLPFSVYLGWISIATIADIALTLTAYGWDGFGLSPEIWAIAVVALVVVLSLLMLGTRRDVAFALVVIWALLGISINQSSHPNVVLVTQVATVIVAIALLAVVAVWAIKRRK